MLSEKDIDVGEVLEKYVFSEKFNFDKNRKGDDKPQSEMLLHPMIHTGYGVKFGLKVILAEGW